MSIHTGTKTKIPTKSIKCTKSTKSTKSIKLLEYISKIFDNVYSKFGPELHILEAILSKLSI